MRRGTPAGHRKRKSSGKAPGPRGAAAKRLPPPVPGTDRVRALVHHLPAVVYSVHLRGGLRMEFYNDMLETLTGFLPSELERGEVSPVESLMHPDDRPAVVRTIREAVEHGTPFEVEYRLRTKAGEPRHVVDRGRPIAGPDGKPLRIDGVIVDVTARRRAEDRIRRVSEVLVGLGADFQANIDRLTALAGETLGAACALYNRLRDRRLCAWGRWQAPPDLPPEDAPEGHICYDVIRSATDDALYVPDLPTTRYAVTDPNVRAFGFQTYLGHVVRCGGTPVGALCVVFQRPFVPEEEDRRVLAILASAIGREEGRREAEEAARRSAEQFRALVENAPDVIMRFDREGRHLYVSPSVTRIVPIRPSEFVGKTHRQLGFPESQCRMWEEAIRTVFDTRTSHESEFVFEDAGRRFVFHWRLVPEFGPRGAVVTVLSLARDITAHRVAEDALRESEARYRSIFENIQDVYYEVRLDGTVLEVSPSVATVSRYRREDLIGTSMYRLYEEAAVRDRLVAILREKGAVRDYEIVLIDKDGSRIPCAVTARLIPGPGGGAPVICGVMRVIAERKRAEEALHRSQNRLRALLDASPVPIIALAADGAVEDWNKAAERMFGYTREEVLGRRNPIVPEAFQDTFDRVLARVLSGEELSGVVRTTRRKDGTELRVRVSSARYCDDAGRPLGLMSLFQPGPDAGEPPPA